MKLQTMVRGAKLVAPLLRRNNPWRQAERTALRDAVEVVQHIREGRFQRSLSLISAFAALLGGMEVTSEHYRGSYSQRVMYSPVFLSPPLVVAGVWGAMRTPGNMHQPLHTLMYGPPLFAPLLFAATGFLGLLASLLRRAD